MDIALDAVLVIAGRYEELAREKAAKSEGAVKERFEVMADALEKVPRQGASNLYEAIQSFILMWQVMCWNRPLIHMHFPWETRTASSSLTVRRRIPGGI